MILKSFSDGLRRSPSYGRWAVCVDVSQSAPMNIVRGTTVRLWKLWVIICGLWKLWVITACLWKLWVITFPRNVILRSKMQLWKSVVSHNVGPMEIVSHNELPMKIMSHDFSPMNIVSHNVSSTPWMEPISIAMQLFRYMPMRDSMFCYASMPDSWFWDYLFVNITHVTITFFIWIRESCSTKQHVTRRYYYLIKYEYITFRFLVTLSTIGATLVNHLRFC